jgi:hypothetical protein
VDGASDPAASFESVWSKYAWLTSDIRAHRALHEARRAGIKSGHHGHDVALGGEFSEAEVSRIRREAKAKLSVTQPKYSNFEGLKRSCSLVGLYDPKAGSREGRVRLMRDKERDAVAFSGVMKSVLPEWAWEVGLDETQLKDLSMELIERKWNNNPNRVANKTAEKKVERCKITGKIKSTRSEKKEDTAVVKAMKAFAKKKSGVVIDNDDGSSQQSSIPDNNYNSMAHSLLLARDIRPKAIAQPLDGSRRGVRVTLSSAGEVLTTVKPEYEHLLSRPTVFEGVRMMELTNVNRPSTTPNPALDYDAFRTSKMQLVKTMAEHREKVYEVKQHLLAESAADVRDKIEAKDKRRVELKLGRERKDRQMQWLKFLVLSAAREKFGKALAEGRRANRWHEITAHAATVIQRNWKIHFSMRMLKLVLAFKDLGLPFSLKVRIRRKHKAVELIKELLDKAKKEAGPAIVKVFMGNVRRAQRYVRIFLACRAARREVVTRYWIKLETKMRIGMKEAARLQQAASQRLLSEIPDMIETQTKFEMIRRKVRKQMIKTKAVETERLGLWGDAEKDAAGHATKKGTKVNMLKKKKKSKKLRRKKTKDKKAVSIEEEGGLERDDGSGSGADGADGGGGGDEAGESEEEYETSSESEQGGDGGGGATTAAANAKPTRNGNMVDPVRREQIIAQYVRTMRIKYLEATNDFVSRSQNNFIEDFNEVKVLFQESKGGSEGMQRLKQFASDLMTTKVVSKPSFCLFTGAYAGLTWKDLVAAEVKRDTLMRGSSVKSVVFRPVKELDEKIEGYRKERFEKLRKSSRGLSAED